MHTRASRRALALATIPIVAFFTVVFGVATAASAHDVSGITASCNDVTVHFVDFPEEGVVVHIAATVEGHDIELTGREFDLLYLLASHPGIVFSRQALIARVWKGDTHVTERSVDTLVKRVRRKIEGEATEPQFILTVWGTGYKFADV